MEVIVMNGNLGSAMFSKDLRYRYALSRVFPEFEEEAPVSICQFIMLNPSTADHDVSDPTVTRCMAYARRWGHTGLLVTNLFGLRATDPRELYKVDDPFGEGNKDFILSAAKQPEVERVVCAWGTHGAYRDAGREMIEALVDAGIEPQVLKWTKDFHPAHPLYLRADLEPFDVVGTSFS